MLYAVLGGGVLLLSCFIIFICWRNFCSTEDEAEDLEGEMGIKVGRSCDEEHAVGGQGGIDAGEGP